MRGRDPTARRRRDPDKMVRDSQAIVRRYQRGESVRSIAAGLRLSKTSVHRVIQAHRGAKALEEVDDLDSETAAALGKMEEKLFCEDVTSAEQIPLLDDLELFRLRRLPVGHPALAALNEAVAGGWKWPWSKVADDS